MRSGQDDVVPDNQPDPSVGLAAAEPLSPENPATDGPAENESVGTVIVAGLANLAIAAAKFVAGLVSGSAAMLSEASPTRSPRSSCSWRCAAA